MAEPFIGEIKMFAGNFAPVGWAFCQGQLLSIAQNSALFSLIGTTYGGNGQTTFALPDLRSRIPIHQGSGPGLGSYVLGQAGGAESVTLTANQIPPHSHLAQGTSADADRRNPKGALLARSRELACADPGTAVGMNSSSVGQTGGGQPHANVQPFLCINFLIALQGIFPSRN